MSTQSLFSRKNIESQQPETSRGLLEELNLPPGLITFIRKNTRSLQIGLICVLVLLMAWIFFDYYTDTQEKKGASLLASALQTDSPEQRLTELGNVVKDYGRTEAARWAKIELAHVDYKEGNFEAAAAKYKELLDALSADNPLAPLTRLSLAQSYEQAGQYDLAIAQYNLLKKSTGFTEQAYLALGRIYMAKEDPVQARKTYEELLGSLQDTSDPLLMSRIEAKLTSLDADKPAISSQPENKE
jgi:predicted negative regulator of RcsB-dependent stress response